MKSACRSVAALSTFALAVAAPGGIQAKDLDPMASSQYLIGTWNCRHTVGDFSGTYVTKWESTRWLKQTYDFPAIKSDGAVHAEYFVGYDGDNHRWVRFGAHSNGQYFGMKSTAVSDNTVSYTYVLPGSGGNVTWTKKSATEYTVDGPTYPQNGKMVTEHHVCRKSP